MLESIKSLISITFLIPLVCIFGLYLSIKCRFLQCTYFFKAWQLFIHDRNPDKKSSSFSAVAAVLGGNLGTGNIAGIAVALAAGGPGALFWMWVMATIGAILKFGGTVLGILFRKKDDQGEFVGGPMYYLLYGLKSKKLAYLFCIFTILSALTVGNLVQMNSLSLPLTELGLPPLAIGIFMAALVAMVILGGLQRFSQVVSKIVPVMAILYIFACMALLLKEYQMILPSLELIIKSAFSPIPLAGGVAGFAVIEGIKSGFDRGLFATDVGAGLAPILHASVESHTSRLQTAITQGIISTISPLIVMIVCTLTGLVLIATGTWTNTELESTNLCIEAFKIGFGLPMAGHIITFTLFFFAFTTILTWSFCADKAIEFMFSRKHIRVFQFIFIGLIPMGVFIKVNVVWTLADLFMNCMLIINVIGLILLSPVIIKKVKYGLKSMKLSH